MSTLGKVLVILNLLAAIAVLVLFPLDYGKRRSWAYSAFLHQTRIDGLPIDKLEKGPDNLPRYDAITPGVATDLMSGSSPVVRTQEEELDRVLAQIREKTGAEDAKGNKEQKLARVLAGFAQTYADREALLRRVADGKANQTEDLEADLTRLFDTAKASNKSPAERKLATARILFGVAEVLHRLETEGAEGGDGGPAAVFASSGYKRAIQIVGLNAAVQTMTDQGALLERMATGAGTALDRDRLDFLAQHARLVYAIQNYADDLQRHQEFLDNVSAEALKQETVRETRRKQVEDLEKELDVLGKQTREQLTVETAKEKMVIERLRMLRDTAARNQDLETQIRALEKELRQPR